MLRDPKEVAKDAIAQDAAGKYSNVRTIANVIRARDREVIAEAKRVVRSVPLGTMPQFLDRASVCIADVIAALDAILKEKE